MNWLKEIKGNRKKGKNMKKKLNKLSKIIMALLMTFTYVAPVTTVVADALEETYELELAVDTGYNLNIKNVGTKSFEDETNYYVEVIPTFSYNDKTTKDGIIQNQNTTGSGLNTGINFVIDSVETNYNGKYKVEVNVYQDDTKSVRLVTDTYTNEITDKGTGISISSADVTHEYTFENGVITLAKDAFNKEINLNVEVNSGNINPANSYALNEVINNTYTNINISTSDSININLTNALYGTYVYVYNYISSKGDVLETNNITINYGDKADNGDIASYFADPSIDELFKIISYTSLTDEEKTLVGDAYNSIAYKHFDKELDDNLNENNSGFAFSYLTGKSSGDNYAHTPYVDNNNDKGRLADTDEISKVSDLVNVVVGLNKEFIFANVYDKNGKEIVVDSENDPYLETGMILKITSYGVEKNYPVYVTADYDGGLVTETDIQELINQALTSREILNNNQNIGDINGDHYLDVLDATAVVNAINTKSWEKDTTTYTDSLTTDLAKSTDLIRVGDEFTVTYKVSDIVKANGISGTMTFDNETLELVDAIVSDGWYGNINTENGNFMYVTGSSNEEMTITFTFKALAEVTATKLNVTNSAAAANGNGVTIGETTELEFAVERALHTNNYLASLTPSVGTLIFNKEVNDYTMYVGDYASTISFSGAVEDSLATVSGLASYDLNYGINDIKVTVTAENGSVNTYNIQVIRNYPLSSNNSLTNISVGGHELKFDPSVLEYSLNVNSDVSSLDLIITPEDANAKVSVKGNENFKEGKNVVEITVTAEDGTEKTYTINVNKKAAKTTLNTKKENSSTGEKIIVIILIILVILGLLYLIFKKEGEPLFPRKNKVVAKKVTPVKKVEPLAKKVEPKKNNNKSKK